MKTQNTFSDSHIKSIISRSHPECGEMGKDMYLGIIKALLRNSLDLEPNYVTDSTNFSTIMTNAQVIKNELKKTNNNYS